jgi:hypothetical protein
MGSVGLRRAVGVRAWAMAAAVACGLLAAAVWGLAAQPGTAGARPLVTGFDSVEDDPLAFRRARESGAAFVVGFVRWSSIAPSAEPASWQPTDPADPRYDWSEIDSWVSNAVAAGLTPLLQVYAVPAWAQGCVGAHVPAYTPCDPDPRKLADFAKAAAARFSGRFAGLPRVRYWQGLNEPNLSLFFNPQFRNGRPASPALYRRLINSFYFAVKAVEPSNVVLAAGLGPIGVPRFTIAPLRFTRKLLCMKGRRKPRPTRGRCGGGVYFDVFDVHPYTTGGPTHPGRADDVQLGHLSKLRDLLRAADQAGRIHGRFRRTPLWVTELSWDSKPPDPGGVPMRILKRWTAEAIYRAWRAGVSRFFWLSLRDNAPDPKLPFSETIEAGLYYRGATLAEDRPKPNLRAFRFPFVAFSRADGFHFWGRTPNSRGGRVAIQIRQGGGWRRAAVARADRNGIFQGRVEGGYGRRKRGTARARYRGETAVPFSLKPVRDFYQPPFGAPVGSAG